MPTSLSPQNEQLLQQFVSSGLFKSEEEALSEALRLLREQSTNGSSDAAILPRDKWLVEFDRITESRRHGNPNMDDSRESIYGDRG